MGDSARITVTREVRELLGELDTLMRRFGQQTAWLCDGALTDSDAVDMGANREQTRAEILGLANRLNKASVRGARNAKRK